MKVYELRDVTSSPDLWDGLDPVRPELDAAFKTAPGRSVFGLKSAGEWAAFICCARVSRVPRDVLELTTLTSEDGDVIVPYTVWSHEKGAGRIIVNKVIDYVGENQDDLGVYRVVTLSPLTEMARRFHLRNSATEFRLNDETVNFEYECKCPVCECLPCDCDWGSS